MLAAVLDVGGAGGEVAVEGFLGGGLIDGELEGKGTHGIRGGDGDKPSEAAAREDAAPGDGIQRVVAGEADAVAQGGGAEDGDDEIEAVRNAPFGEGLGGVGGRDVGQPGNVLGGAAEAADAGGGVDEEFAGLLPGAGEVPLQEVVHEAHGELQVLEGVVDGLAALLRHDELVALRDRAQAVHVELVIEPERDAVDRLDGVGDGRDRGVGVEIIRGDGLAIGGFCAGLGGGGRRGGFRSGGGAAGEQRGGEQGGKNDGGTVHFWGFSTARERALSTAAGPPF